LAAARNSNVLLLGEAVQGKDIFAQAIHNESLRRNGPFVAINCGAIPKELIAPASYLALLTALLPGRLHKRGVTRRNLNWLTARTIFFGMKLGKCRWNCK
jgi:hypothetical protein